MIDRFPPAPPPRQVPRLADGPTGDRNRDLRGTANRLRVDLAALEAVQALKRAGIGYILLKGPTTAARLYGDSYRSYVDVDLLVSPDDVAAALAALRDLGYGVHGQTNVEYDLRRALDGSAIDLHSTLAEARASPGTVWRAMSEHAGDFGMHGRVVCVLDEPAHACHLALHAARSGCLSRKPMVDLELGILRFPQQVWQQAVEIAVQLDAVGAFNAGLRCYASSGQELADALGLPRSVGLWRKVRAVDRTGLSFVPALWQKVDWSQRIRLLRRWSVPDRALVGDRLVGDPLVRRLPESAPYGLRLALFRGHQLGGLGSAVVSSALTGRRRARSGGALPELDHR